MAEFLTSIDFAELFTANNIVFCLLSAVILVCGFMSVASTKILRAATYLFFTLFAVAGLYLTLDYEFLAAVQLSVYAGGILVLLIFAIMLVKNLGTDTEETSFMHKSIAAFAALAGTVFAFITMSKCDFSGSEYVIADNLFNKEIGNTMLTGEMKVVGADLLGTDKYQYLLAFEAVSILLLACIVGSIVIANKSKEE
ncbi:MAG: NADH-quinone oxidoreductase subunit J [Bacteroidales bacterium]|nr:NADH-quinone oxidoreductase subunit J [Candidatus Scybalocola fimicaballi]